MEFLLTLFVAMLAMACDAGPSRDTVRNAVFRARDIVAAQRENNDRFKVSSGKVPSCSHMLRMNRVLDDQTAPDRAKVLLTTTRLLMEDGFQLTDLHTPEITSAVTSALNFDPSESVTCDPCNPYRPIDGSCNNLDNPEWGKAGVAQRRVVPSAYADGLGSPRAFSVTGDNVPLPNPRTISTAMHKADKMSKKSKTNTLQLMAFAQFLSNDILFTPLSDATGCCSGNTNDDCFPLIVEKADDTFPAGYCMDVSRSAAFSSSNELGTRQQSNQITPFIDGSSVLGSSNDEVRSLMEDGAHEQQNHITSYIDGSNVYGSSKEEMTSLKEAGTGLLRTASQNRLPDNPDGECRLSNETQNCSLAGDARVNGDPTLSLYHTIWMREHNRIVAAMSASITDTETLFQEARRIVIAEMQHITYNGFLPALLSPETMADYGLQSGQYEYDSTVDATTTNSFGNALRFAHTWVSDDMNLFNQNFKVLRRGKLEDNLLDPALTYEPEGLEELAYWLSADTIQKTDRVIGDAVRNRMFVDDQGDSFDLVALDIHRGRDHGLPSYNHFRKWCGLSHADDFTTDAGGLVNHDADMVKRLDSVYDNIDDIDLSVGSLTETAVSGGLVGPTLQCIIGSQFRALKRGDRFWFEGEAANFTPEQLKEIKKASLSKLLCDNMNFKKIQKDAFDARSKMMKCSEIKGMDLAKFFPSSG